MSNHTESRPSFSGIGVGRPSRPSRDSRDAILSPPPLAAPATMPSKQSHELVDQLQSLVDDMKRAKDSDGHEKESLVENVKRIAKAVQQKVAKLGGIATPKRDEGADTQRTSRTSIPGGRMSISPSLDGYRPGTDVVAPISVRPNAMELIWVCGDCGAHFPRRAQPPETCSECGAPKTNFYSPIED